MVKINYFIILMLKYKFDLCMELGIIIYFKIKKLVLIFLLILKIKFKIKLNKYLKMEKI